MQEKVLLNVLEKIGTGEEHTTSPDDNYLDALNKIGLIEKGWDNKLTHLGKVVKNYLQDRNYKW